MPKIRSLLGGFLLALGALHGTAMADEFPSRPIKLVLPYGPGGTSDTVARVLGEKLSQTLGQQVVTDYRPGGGTAIGIEAAIKAAPDGYTILLTNLPSLAVIPVARKVNYETLRDLQPLGRIGDQIIGLAVNLKVPANNLQEFIALAKANPGKLNYGSAGIGSAVHFAGEIFKIAAGVDIVHIPYKGGGGEALADLLAGVIDAQLEGVVFAQARAGKVRLLAVTTPVRYVDFPDTPSITEIVPGFSFDNWYGVSMPVGAPPAIVQKLSTEIAKAAGSADFKDRMLKIGVLARTDTPAGMTEDIKQQTAKYTKLVKELDIKME
jgi:tripartite-type tricarboxylate transporter receptor subunit TctC